MTAFDGNNSLVTIYLEGDGDEINISLSDDPKDQDDWAEDSIRILPSDVPEIVSDLVGAYNIRTGLFWTEETDKALSTLFPVHSLYREDQ